MNADSEQNRMSGDLGMTSRPQLDSNFSSPNKFFVLGEHLFWGDYEIALSVRSDKLLRCLVEAKGGFCSKDELINAGWTDENPHAVSAKALSEAIRRMKIELHEELRIKSCENFVWIKSVRGRGYRLIYSEMMSA